MAFSERFDFLMSLTNTTNVSVARAVSFDASYISRIRSGRRGVPRNQPFVRPVAEYLATRVVEDYQRRSLEQMLRLQGPWPESAADAASLLEGWLEGPRSGINERIGGIIGDFSSVRPSPAPAPAGVDMLQRSEAQVRNPASCECYIGNAGKRQAVEIFLTEVVEAPVPELLLYSDEDMSWMVEDVGFSRRWAALLSTLLQGGTRIKIIHTLGRDFGQMLDAVRSWLPLYMTGKIESYYCPKVRDGLFSRSLFVARGRCAIASNSIGTQTDRMANLLVHDRAAVRAYEAEFSNLLALCVPLVRVSELYVPEQLPDLAVEIVREEGALCVAHNIPALDGTVSGDICGVDADDLFSRTVMAAAPDPERVDVFRTDRLPENVGVIAHEHAGFVLMRFAQTPLAMSVHERLMATSFFEYLQSTH